MLNPGEGKCCCGPLVKVGCMSGFGLNLNHCGLSRPADSCCYLLSCWLLNLNRHTCQLEASSHSFSDLQSKDIRKAPRTSPSCQEGKLNTVSLEKLQGLLPLSRTWKMPLYWCLLHLYFICLFGLCRSGMELGEWPWNSIHLIRYWLYLQLLLKMWRIYWSKSVKQITAWHLVCS